MGGRPGGEPPVAQSPLRRPRRQAAPTFQRKAAFQGFKTVAGFGGPLKANRRRAHEAGPSDWIIEDPGFAEAAFTEDGTAMEQEAGDRLGQLASEMDRTESAELQSMLLPGSR